MLPKLLSLLLSGDAAGASALTPTDSGVNPVDILGVTPWKSRRYPVENSGVTPAL